MKLEKQILTIARSQSLAGRDTEKLTFDGLCLCIGTELGCAALIEFDTKYNQRHGSYFDVAQKDFVSGDELQGRAYARKRNLVWNRYALMLVHKYELAQQRPLRTGYEGNYPDPHKFP